MRKFLSLIVRIAIIVFLGVLLIIFTLLKLSPSICEAWTRGIARFFGLSMSTLTKNIPFSLTEVFFVLMIVGIIFLLVLAILSLRKLKIITMANRLLDIAFIVLLSINIYTVSCEFAYKRKEMPLPYYESEVVRTEHIPIFNYYANDANKCISELEFTEKGEVKIDMSLSSLTKEVIKAYDIIKGNSYFASHFGGVKPMVSSFLYREFQITGVTYSPLGEANINILNTKTDLPLTVAHELAHTKGVMREDDANKLAFYVCLNSEHPYLRYSAYTAYFYQLEAMTTSYYLTDEERASLVKVDPMLAKTRNYEREFWKKHDLLGKIGDWFNNLYIKSSGIKEGTTSYSGGTEYVHDPTTSKLIPSLYQKLFFEKYYRE